MTEGSDTAPARAATVLVDAGRAGLAGGRAAALQACLNRIGPRLPGARLCVLTASPWRLRRLAPAAEASTSFDAGGRPAACAATLSRRVAPAAVGLALDVLGRRPGRARPAPADPGARARAALAGVDLLVVVRGGEADAGDPADARRALALLDAARAAGVPAAVLGWDGVGLDAGAGPALGSVALAALRTAAARSRLVPLGLPGARAVLAGDDALAVALGEPPIPPGRGIGVAIGHAAGATGHLDALRGGLHAAGAALGAPLVELVLSSDWPADHAVTRRLTSGCPDVVPEDRPSRPAAAVARRIAGCRVVLTDRYPVALLALARGVPVVCAHPPAGDPPWAGDLRDAFGAPGAVRGPAASGWEDALRRAWEAAPALRGPLLAAAGRQAAAQESCLARAAALVPGAIPDPGPAPEVPAGGPDLALSVVIPCRNAGSTLARAVSGLADDGWDEPWEIVVADNGSTDDTAAVVAGLARRYPMLRMVDASGRPGAAHARNVGARAARGRSVAFFDADDIPHPGWVAAMGRALDRHAFVACRLDSDALNDARAIAVRGRPQSAGLLPTDYPPYLPAASGGTVGLRRSVFLDVGGFDETLPLAGEDIEFCWRVQLAGHSLHFVPEAAVSMRFRSDLRDVFQQARRYGYGQPAVYERYRLVDAPAGGPAPPPPRPSRLRAGRIAERLGELRSPEGRARWVWRCGWYTGVAQGTVRRHLDGIRG